MDMRFFPVLKKAAPTNIFGLGLRLPKEMVIAFLGSADLAAVVLLEGAAGFAATLQSHKLMLFHRERKKLMTCKTTKINSNQPMIES